METDPLPVLLASTGVKPADLVPKLREQGVRLTLQAVSSWYRGETRPRDDDRPAVARALGVDLDRLLRACAGVAS